MVLAPALLLTAVLDQLGLWFFADSGVYAWPIFEGHFTTALFFATLANFQGILLDYFGTNGPMWSLACEFWYYILFPLLMMPLAAQRSIGARIILFGLGASLTVLFARQPGWFGFGFILWSIGALATRAPRPLIRSRIVALSLYAVTVIVIRLLARGELLATHSWIGDVADLTSAMLFIVVLLAFRDGPVDGYKLLRSKLHKKLADFSFSLYAIHMPILILARAGASHLMGDAWVKQLAQPSNYLLALLIMAMIVLIAWGFSRLTEAYTGAARRVLRTRLDRIAPLSAPVGD
jgi:peptidoglycan/LPS O-acetylase OafA/YrhL